MIEDLEKSQEKVPDTLYNKSNWQGKSYKKFATKFTNDFLLALNITPMSLKELLMSMVNLVIIFNLLQIEEKENMWETFTYIPVILGW